MEQPGPASDAHIMEGSEAESVSEGSPPVDQLNNGTTNVENEEQINQNGADDSEMYSQAEDKAQTERELIKSTTYVETDTETEAEALPCSQEQLEGSETYADTGCHNSTVSMEEGISLFSDEAGGALVAPETSLDNVVENSPAVHEGTTETLLTFDEDDVPQATTQNCNAQPSVVVTNCSTEPLPADADDGSPESPSPSSVQSTSESSPTDPATTSGISNGPSTPSSDTVSSSLASSPQTSANTSAPSQSSSSPYDTDCSRKLISQIQRSLSQESLLDELESELLDCQLPEGESGSNRKGSSPVNGLPSDQEDCMMVFEKCIQYKYAQQEKAIKR